MCPYRIRHTHKMEYMISDAILQLLAKKMGKDASPEEEAELQRLLQQHPDHHLLVEVLQSIEGEKLHKEPVLGEDQLVHESWQTLQQQLNATQPTGGSVGNERGPSVRRLFPIWMRRIAVCIGLILVGGTVFFVINNLSEQTPAPSARISQVKVPNGMTVKKILPDSSVVWLNAGSHIRYDSSFTQKTRDVYLVGEAYFNVAHDADRPFVVRAGNVTVQALGTEFNVQAYHDANKIEATLISGKVLVKIDGKPGNDIILSPNEKLTINNKAYSLSNNTDTNSETASEAVSFNVKAVAELPAIATIPEVAWLQDRLAFENELFDELAKRMERRYDIHIIFKDTQLRYERLNGVFENESIQKALRLLQMTTRFQYQIQGDTVYIGR